MSQSLTHSVSVTDDTERSSAAANDVNSNVDKNGSGANNNGDASLVAPDAAAVLTHSTEFTVDKVPIQLTKYPTEYPTENPRGAQVGSKSEAERIRIRKSLLGGDFDGQMLIFREMLEDQPPASPGN